MTIRRWKFAVETDDGDGYLLASGKLVTDPEDEIDFIGSDNDAWREADLRGRAYENLTGSTSFKIIYESQGQVKPRHKPKGQPSLL